MKKVLFFTEPWWAFGAIHYGLSKILYQHKILCNVIDWRTSYSLDEKKYLRSSYDVFVTTPHGVVALFNEFGVDLNKIISVSHSVWDIKVCSHLMTNSHYDSLLGYSVVCDHLVSESINIGINRIPTVTKIGIDFDLFYKNPPSSLSTVGYAGAKYANNVEQVEIKRYDSFCKMVDLAGLSRNVTEMYHFASMPGFYESVDAIVVTSSEEGAGLPSMEAAAAGRLVFSTPVGYFFQNHDKGAGVLLPIEGEQMISKGYELLSYYKENSKSFIEMCHKGQDFAKDNYDWPKVIDPWISLIGG